MVDFTKISALAAQAAAIKDQTVAQTGGGDYVPPAAGSCKLRLVSYVELGKHEEEFKGVKKLRDKVQLTFEVSGKNHPPLDIDGVKRPILITVKETLSLNEKARFFKLFTRMNYAGKARHMSQLIGEAFLGKIVHRTYKRRDGTEGVAVELYDKEAGSYTITPPRIPKRDEEGLEIVGEFTVAQVDQPLTPLSIFLWDFADLEQWASIYIDGEYPERKDKDGKVTAPAKSKNVVQNTIKLAKNFAGSPIQMQLLADGQSVDIPDAESVADDVPPSGDDEAPAPAPAPVLSGGAATDALNGIVG